MIVDCYSAHMPIEMSEYYVLQSDNIKIQEWIVNNYFTFVDAAIKDLTAPPMRAPVKKEVIYAIIYQESRGNPYAYRYEPGFFDWLSTRITPTEAVKGLKQYVSKKTEMVGRATSFGPMQILGQTAREMGFKGPYLTELCNPEEGVYYSTKYLLSRIKKYSKENEHIAAFNSGTPKYKTYAGAKVLVNESYVKSVLQHAKAFKELLND